MRIGTVIGTLVLISCENGDPKMGYQGGIWWGSLATVFTQQEDTIKHGRTDGRAGKFLKSVVFKKRTEKDAKQPQSDKHDNGITWGASAIIVPEWDK